MQKLVDILTSYPTPKTVSAIGNEAIARGAIECGVNAVFSYPGTPSTEISEIFNLIQKHHIQNDGRNHDIKLKDLYFEYSINEKVALEKAIAWSIGNKSSLCVMKNVGMNVASDALMSITYQTIIAPLVIVVCDDPGCHSSSNEQDSRHWGTMASVPVFDPATPEDAYEMTKSAFHLSEMLRIPVIVRSTTRVSHTRGMLAYHEIKEDLRIASFEKLPEHINIPARTAKAHEVLLEKLRDNNLISFFERFCPVLLNSASEKAIIGSGVAISYIKEVLAKNNAEDKVRLLQIGLVHPFPTNLVKDFLKSEVKEVLVVEELDPVMENRIRAIAQQNNLNLSIKGKYFGGLKPYGELSLEIIADTLGEFVGFDPILNQALEGGSAFSNELPARPPALCSGCPHRATYYVMKLIFPRDNGETILCGDIGCSGLGALPPLKMIDTINHMGMSISMAQGLSQALGNKQKVVAMLGDGTFFHSGIPSLLNAVYTKTNMLVIIFDNRTIGMTGHQDHPGATHLNKYQEIDIPPLLKGMGIEFVETLLPFDIKDTYTKIKSALKTEGVAVLVSKAPCIFLPDYKNLIPADQRVEIDPNRCNTCHNHADLEISCSRASDPKSNIHRAIAKIDGSIQINAKAMSCPANICNHGFLNSIQENDYKTALDMIRDKLLFARTCGDICHRPCELFSGQTSENTVPIKALKKYVSGIDANFNDFSRAETRTKNAFKKGNSVGIVGGGPAGLSAAYDLIREGYDVTVYEKDPIAGGLIRQVIPNFRMDKSGFEQEVGQLEKLGVQFKYNAALGKDYSLDDLTKLHDGIILAIGMHQSKQLPILNTVSSEKKIDAISFLKNYNSNSGGLNSSSNILIIGGGNSAMDAARAAKKQSPSCQVMVACLERMDKMPAFQEEIEHALKENVLILDNRVVSSCHENERILVKLNNAETGLPCEELEIDYVIYAIGQEAERFTFSSIPDHLLTKDNRVTADLKTGNTGFNNVFIAGDLCADNHMSLIGAIGSGKRAATGIRNILENYPHHYEGLDTLLALNDQPERPSGSAYFEHQNPISVASQFNLYQTCEKCNHCIDNLGCPAMIKVNGKVTIEQSKCTRCGLCVDVCPNDAIHWVKIKERAHG